MNNIRRLTEEDLFGAAELEKLCFSEPWSENALRLLLGTAAFGTALSTQNHPVAAYGGLFYSVDEGQILNVAVHPDERGRGLGSQIVDSLLAEAERKGFSSVSLEVRASNAPALSLYRKKGFAEVGRRKHFYKNPTEDAILMEKVLKAN